MNDLFSGDTPRNPAGLRPVRPAPPPRPTVSSASVGLRLGFVVVALIVAASGWIWFARLPQQAPPTAPPIAVPEITLPGRQIDPVISPDGTRIAFAWQAPERAGVELYVKQVGSEQLLRLTEGPANAARIAWTTDGQHLAYLYDCNEACGIFRVAALGGAADRLGDCMSDIRDLDWSPDGTHIVYSAIGAPETPRGIFRLDVATGSSAGLVTAPENSRGDKSPAYSPDGRYLAFVRMALPSRHEVWVADADGSDEQRLTADRWGQIRGLDWSADGQTIVFSSNRNGRYALWRVPPTGGDPVRLPIQDEWVTEPGIAATGRVIYKNFADVTDIWETDLSSDGSVASEPRKIVASTRSELYPALSPDGKAVAFTSDRTGHFEVWSADRDGANAMRHTDFRGPRPGSPRWSPDGRHIVFDADADGHSDVWFVARNGRQPSRMTHEFSENRNPVFARDGRSIYFTSNREDGWQIWQLPSDGGAPTRVTTDGGFMAQEGALGEFLYWVRLDEPGIWRQALENSEGGEATLVLAELGFDDWASWQVTRNGIWFIRHDPTAILYHRFGAGDTIEIHATAKQVPYLGRSLSVAADESMLLFGMIDHSDDEILYVDLGAIP